MARQLRQAGQPVVPVGHQHGRVTPGVNLTLAIRRDDSEGAVGQWFDVLYAGLKGDLFPETEVIDVTVEVPSNLRVVREIRVVRGHGKIGKLHLLARAVNVQRLV